MRLFLLDSEILNDVITLQVGRKNSVETVEEYNEIFLRILC